MKGLYRGFCRNENGTETIVLNGERIKGDWVQGNLFVTTLQYPNKEVKEYHIYDSYIGIGEDDLPCYQSGLDEIVLPETVCEAVRGLTDRNGKQVFEGDKAIAQGHRGNVVFASGAYAIDYDTPITEDWLGTMIYCLEGEDNTFDIEVIGTIFDEQFSEGV